MMVARTILARHYRSGWLICETVLAVALAVVTFRSIGDAQYVFGSASIGLGVLGMIFAAVLAHGAQRAGVRGPLVAAHGRAAFVRGLLLAAGSIRAGICILVVAVVLGLGRLSDATAGMVLVGTTGLIGTCVLLATGMVVASSPLTTRGERMALLAVLDGALYSLANSGWLAGLLWVTRVPLLPIVACYEVSVAGQLSWAWLGALLLAGCCLVSLAWLGERLLARAEIGTEHVSGSVGA
jgi:hypothetical protein